MATLTLVNAAAGRRLAAKAVDLLPALLVGLGVFLVGGGLSGAGLAYADPGAYLALNAVGQLVVLGYWVWLWGWEATSGKTPGNLLLGLRTTGMDGLRAGWGRIFLRNLVIGLVSMVPVIGFVLVMVSNLWDRDGRRRGWHDLAAGTLVFDVRAGRNPLATGGVDGPASFAPPVQEQQAPLQPVASPLAGRVISAVPGFGTGPERPMAAAAAPERPGTAVSEHPDDEPGVTRVTGRDRPLGVRIVFDDGKDAVVRSEALIGRNPAGHDGEMIDQLIGVADEGRSVSKTHLHLRVEAGQLWVTDRQSTNGTFVLAADGTRTQLSGGQPSRVPAGCTVAFGDRSFRVDGP